MHPCNDFRPIRIPISAQVLIRFGLILGQMVHKFWIKSFVPFGHTFGSFLGSFPAQFRVKFWLHFGSNCGSFSGPFPAQVLYEFSFILGQI